MDLGNPVGTVYIIEQSVFLKDNMKKIIFIRHARSQHNANDNCLSGVSDVDLEPIGCNEAKHLCFTGLVRL